MSSHNASFPWQYKGALPTQHSSPLGSSQSSLMTTFQSVGVKLLPVPRGVTNMHLPSCTSAPGSLAPGWVGEPGFLCNQEEKVTHKRMESKGWNCCPNRAPIIVCPIPKGAGHRIRMCFPWILTHQLFTRHCGSSLLCQILASKS